MTTVLLAILLISGLTFIAVAICCTLLTTRDSGGYKEKYKNGQRNYSGFSKNQLCSGCKTGKYTYELDSRSEACPYIGCLKGNKCRYYKPLDRTQKTDIQPKKKSQTDSFKSKV